MPANPFLERGFEPLRVEYAPFDLEISGTLPTGLSGTFYRIGPSPQFEPRGAYNPLNGDGMVHAFRIGGGRVSYRNRWVRTRQWTLDHAAGRALFGTSGLPTDRDVAVLGMATDGVANTNLVRHGGRLLALEEGNAPIAIDPVTLETLGGWDFGGALPRNMTAHPKIDPVTGEMWLIANFEDGRATGLHRVGPSGAVVGSAAIAGPFGALIHDFALTERFAVIAWCAAVVSLKRAMAGGPLIAWEPERGTMLAVLPRDGSAEDVRWFEGPPAMAWHVMNAWDAAGRITVDVCAQDAAAFPLADGTAPDEAALTQRLTRWTLDWDGPRRFEAERLLDERCEYPRIDERRAGRTYRHGWVACRGGPGSGDLFHRGLGRFDAEARSMAVFDAGPAAALAEPVFAPKAGGGEGEGWVLTQAFDEKAGTSALLVFDALAVEAGPVARAEVGHRVPVGFHGLWLAAD